jgi:hypothetical protein
VAVFGLYGAATSKWDMSVKVEESGAFDAFWDAIAFIVNAIVFFYSGVACINFFVRCSHLMAVHASPLYRSLLSSVNPSETIISGGLLHPAAAISFRHCDSAR